MGTSTIRVTSTHHVAVRFECAAETVWRDIVEGLGKGRRFEAQCYRVAPLDDDPRAYLGGYRMARERGDDPDERQVFVTERDDSARQLSLCAYYLGAQARGTVVNATYSAVPDGAGCWYRIDCHATYDLEIDEGASPKTVATMMAASKIEMDRHLTTSLEAQQAELGAGAAPLPSAGG